MRLCGGTQAHAAAGGDSRAQHLRAVLRAALHAVPLRRRARRSRSCWMRPPLSVYLLCALAMVAFVVWASRNSRIGWNDASFGALVAAFPNTGFMGVPLLVALLGAQAAGPAILTILVDLLITSSLCIALSRLDGADEHGASKAAKNALKGVAINPMPWAIVLGGARVGLAVGADQAAGADHRPAGRFGLAGRAVHDRRRAGALAIHGRAGRTRAHALARFRARGLDQAAGSPGAGVGRGQCRHRAGPAARAASRSR